MGESKIKVPSGSGCDESSLATEGHLLSVPSHGRERGGYFSLPLLLTIPPLFHDLPDLYILDNF